LRPARIALALLTVAGVAGAEPADPAAMAERAAELCGAGDLDSASAALRDLKASLESGPDSHRAGLPIVNLYLAQVERARGDEQAALALERASAADGESGTLDRSLKRALRGLRVCTAHRTPSTPPPPPPQPDADAFQKHLGRAWELYRQARFAEALRVAEHALGSAGPRANPAERLSLYEMLIGLRLELGDRAGSLKAAREADAVARELEAVEPRIRVARLVAQAGDLEGSGTALDALAPLAQSQSDRAQLEEARGELALLLGSPGRALDHLERALAGYRRSGAGDRTRARVLHMRGDAHRLAGDLQAAMREYGEALRLRESDSSESGADIARSLNAIGLLHDRLRDWTAADEAYRAALKKLRERFPEDHHEIITVRLNRALARWRSTRGEDSAAEYASTVDALEKALGADHPKVAVAIGNLAHFEFDRGNAARAQALIERALSSLDESDPAHAPTLLEHGRLLAHRGKLAAAAAAIDRAKAELVASRGPDHPTVTRARVTRARVAVAQRDGARGFREAVEASNAIAVHTRRTFGAITDRQRAALSQDAQDVIGALLSAPESKAPARDLFVALLPHRDSALRSVAASHESRKKKSGQQGELRALRERYVAALTSQVPGAAQRAATLAREIDVLEMSTAWVGRRAPEPAPEEVLKRACARLSEDAALVKFVAYARTRAGAAEWTAPAYAALVVRGGSCAVHRVDLGDGGPIDEAAEAFAVAMREQRSDAPASREALSRRLLTPLEGAVAGARRWLVVPDGSLWGVPIGALPDPAASGRHLLERVTVGYLTSTYELADAEGAGSGDVDAARALLVGAPDFGSGEGGRGPVLLTASGPCRFEPFEMLPATRSELDDIAERVESSRLLVDAEVTKPRLEQELGRKPWLVHIATHAYFAGLGGCGADGGAGEPGAAGDPGSIAPNPLLLSGIVLAGANRPARAGVQAQSGILTAYEVAGLDLRSAGLVVLSACDTGTGLHLRGQEIQGLRWGFRAAGAGALVTSLWRSNDVATRKLMRAFYDVLASKEIPRDAFRGAEALRRAQLEQIEGDRRLGIARTNNWANFVFSGVL
jgi:CHAT domain-containing protein